MGVEIGGSAADGKWANHDQPKFGDFKSKKSGKNKKDNNQISVAEAADFQQQDNGFELAIGSIHQHRCSNVDHAVQKVFRMKAVYIGAGDAKLGSLSTVRSNYFRKQWGRRTSD